MEPSLIITCEHAGKIVPTAYTHLFQDAWEVLGTHEGWDPGAIEIALMLSNKLNAPLFKCEATRLLVEPNRSLNSTSLFSQYCQSLTEPERAELLNQYYYPHRKAVEEWIENSTKPVLHLSIHTFTPAFKGVSRKVDIGLLFDPDRKMESRFCSRYRESLRKRLPEMNIEFNEPYKGTDDGFTTYLRTRFGDDGYMGIEIEVSQRFNNTTELNLVGQALANAVDKI